MRGRGGVSWGGIDLAILGGECIPCIFKNIRSSQVKRSERISHEHFQYLWGINQVCIHEYDQFDFFASIYRVEPLWFSAFKRFLAPPEVYGSTTINRSYRSKNDTFQHTLHTTETTVHKTLVETFLLRTS